MYQIDLNNINSVHIVGIGGAGMSAIATVLLRMGKKVSGSDLKESHVTERLRSMGIDVSVPHDAKCINKDLDVLVRSSAIGDDNVEVIEAKSSALQVISRAVMLSAICAKEKSIGVAGSHGKTTTTSMVSSIARAGDLNPSFMIGGDVNEIGTNAYYNAGSYLIVEADESDRTFLDLDLVAGIVTNIENDHLESYDDSFDSLKQSFIQYINNIQGPVVVCVDEENAREVSKQTSNNQVITVGKNNADWTYEITGFTRGGIKAAIKREGDTDTVIELAVPGEHNIKNALCAYALMHALGVSDSDCQKGLSSFGGVARRFQFRGETRGITFVDDYAHLPTEISATLSAAEQGNFSNVIAIFQPHRYSRTQSLYKDFAKSLSQADKIIVCEIYSAGEEPRPGVTGALIIDELLELGRNDAKFVRHVEEIVEIIDEITRPGDLVLTLGAGDVTMYPDIIQDQLSGA